MQRTVKKTRGHCAKRDRFTTITRAVAVGVAGDTKTADLYENFLSNHGIRAVVRNSRRKGHALGVVLMVMEKDFERAYELIESLNMANDYFEDICQFGWTGEDGAEKDETEEDGTG